MKSGWSILGSAAMALVAGMPLSISASVALGADGMIEREPSRAHELAARGERLLWLRTGVVDCATRPSALLQKSFGKGMHVLMLDGPMTRERRAALENAGVRVGDPLPMNAVIADVSGATPQALAEMPFVVWTGAYDDAWRIDAGLLKPDMRTWSSGARQELKKKGLRFVSIWHFNGAASKETLAAIVKVKGANVTYRETVAGGEVVYATLPQASIAGLSRLANVQFVEEVPEFVTRSTSTTRWVVQTNTLNQTPLYTLGITGVGQLVNINDDPVGITHCALLDAVNPVGPSHRKVQFYSGTPTYSRHGTMVSGILVGDAGVNDDTRGIAYGARMTFGGLPFLTEPSITSLFSQHFSLGAPVSNNSWGDDGTTAYNGPCRAIDAFAFSNPTHLSIFAISNQTTIRNPENAKNPIAVGNSFNAPAQENMCGGGVGPTSDGRTKPDVTAPGCTIFAAASNGGCATQQDSGTSFATPAVTGVATLVRQYFMDGFYPTGAATPADAFVPTGTLIKAVVLNGAQDMSAVAGYPSSAEGWGRVRIVSSLALPGETRRVVVRDQANTTSTLDTGESVEMYIAVRDSSETLRATLAFADAPAAVNAAVAPVNNLDLQLISPGGVVYRGNVFASGVSVPGGVADAINSVEQIKIPNPVPGRWRVRVIASAVNQGPQGFATATSGVVDDVACAADLDDGGALGQSDNAVDINDLLFFLAKFENGLPVVDLDDGSGLGRPDGGVDISDLLFFLVRFEAGC
jgi:hypothetical protein